MKLALDLAPYAPSPHVSLMYPNGQIGQSYIETTFGCAPRCQQSHATAFCHRDHIRLRRPRRFQYYATFTPLLDYSLGTIRYSCAFPSCEACLPQVDVLCCPPDVDTALVHQCACGCSIGEVEVDGELDHTFSGASIPIGMAFVKAMVWIEECSE
jgi:hypothetical protein